jgi:glycosyltransferase involved in cell wall biosynthesis
MKQNLPLVSIAIITYNQKDYLKECIESCLVQDYSNFEIIVADDYSTDGTQDMLRSYDVEYPGKFVLCLAEKNQGITPNSNVAHFACSGKYIAWMGGDDLMYPEKLSKQVSFMEANENCTICYSNSEVFESSTGKIITYSSKLSPCIDGTIQHMIRYGCFVGGCTAMVRRSSTPKHGFDTRVPIASDWLYWVESLESGGKVNYLDFVLSKHRRHNDNITSNDKSDFRIELLQDHLISASIILSKYPFYYKDVSRIMSLHLRSMRWYKGGEYYRRYLLASMKSNLNAKAFFAYALSFFGIKK